MDAQADLSLRWAHMPFCYEAAQMFCGLIWRMLECIVRLWHQSIYKNSPVFKGYILAVTKHTDTVHNHKV